jgi:plasmid stabilization system protein ParE
MSGYVLSVDAEFDLDDIWEYIAADNIDAADRRIEKLFSGELPAWDTGAKTSPRTRFYSGRSARTSYLPR